MSDPSVFREVSSQSWLSRLAESAKGVLLGLLLFLAGFPVLWWNEGKAVRVARGLEEGAGAVVSLAEPRVDGAQEGKLVHLGGEATTDETLTDPVLGVGDKALRLVREVELYQWVERSSSRTEKKLGGGTETVTEYRYEKEWSSHLVDSGAFKQPSHENPTTMEVAPGSVEATHVTLGDFTLPPALVGKVQGSRPVALDARAVAGLPARLKPLAHLAEGGLYVGAAPSSPQVGDLRVRLRAVPPQLVSVVAQQQGHSLVPYLTKQGTEIYVLDEGLRSAAEMFADAQRANALFTWLLRLAGFAMMFLGVFLVLRPLVTLGDVVPLVGSLLGFGAGVVAFVVAFPCALTVVAIAWVVHRPLLGVGLLVLAAGAVVGFRLLGRKRSAPAVQPAMRPG